jgi:hypothetical protein
MPRVAFQFGDLAARLLLGRQVVHVAEDNRLGRAGRLAGDHDLAVTDVGQFRPVGVLAETVFVLSLDFAVANPLDAKGALLHHPPAADGDLGIPLQLHALGRPVGVAQEVEPAHLVRTVVRAVAGADAAVVSHLVETIGAVRRGLDRADDLAGRVLAVHAHERLERRRHRFRLGRVAAQEFVDPQPVHDPAAGHFRLADDRDVVLRLAGDHAAAASGAGVEVDDHAPLVAVVFVPGIQIERFDADRGLFLRLVETADRGQRTVLVMVPVDGETIVVPKFRQRRRPDDPAPPGFLALGLE